MIIKRQHEEVLGVRKLFSILIMVVVTQIYIWFKIPRSVYQILKACFNVWYFKKGNNKNVRVAKYLSKWTYLILKWIMKENEMLNQATSSNNSKTKAKTLGPFQVKFRLVINFCHIVSHYYRDYTIKYYSIYTYILCLGAQRDAAVVRW